MSSAQDYLTQYWSVDPSHPQLEFALSEAAILLQQGRTVAFPTETVYGLGADARSDVAVERIFQAKGRPADNPLIVHIAEKAQVETIAATPISPVANILMDYFWPGPLTIVCPVKPGVISAKVTAGLATVGLRMPDHPIALALIKAAGVPLAAPSANRSGRPSPTSAKHVQDDLHGRIAGVVDGGACAIGLESTVVEIQDDAVIVLRPGGISVEQLREVHPNVRVDPALQNKLAETFTPRSPGMKYSHYAPKGEMVVITGPNSDVVDQRINELTEEAIGKGLSTGVLTYTEAIANFPNADLVLSYGRKGDDAEAAKQLYEALRQFDQENIDYIISVGLPERHMGFAVMNRLVKAAGGKIIEVNE